MLTYNVSIICMLKQKYMLFTGPEEQNPNVMMKCKDG